MRSLLVAIIIGSTSIASFEIAQAAPLDAPVLPQHSLVQNVADKEMTVVGTAVNVRQHPSRNSKVLATMNSGDKVVVTGSSGSWTRIRVSNSMDGYISTRFLK